MDERDYDDGGHTEHESQPSEVYMGCIFEACTKEQPSAPSLLTGLPRK